MSMVLHGNSDLVYLPDHGFAGEEGALRILPQITRRVHRLDISHNLLGSTGTLTLFQGLTTVRARYSSDASLSSSGPWGLKYINLGVNALDDAALDGVMGYAKKDVRLQTVLVQGNRITLKNNLESIVNSLNSSRISSFSLTNNPALDPKSVSTFFDLLNAPFLKELHLSTCNLPSPVADSIANYLRSDRARDLEDLQLNGNHLSGEGVRDMINAIDDDNFSLVSLGLFANHATILGGVNGVGQEAGDNGDQPMQHDESRERVLMADRGMEDRMMDYQVHQRLPELLQRNKELTRRVRKAALKTISKARIILNAQRPSDESTAHQVISELSQTSQPVHSSNYLASSGYDKFRLLDLPEEVVHLIVRHTSGDIGALSENQWIRLRKEAVDRGSLQRAYESRQERMRGKGREDERDVDRTLKEDWLRAKRCTRWER